MNTESPIHGHTTASEFNLEHKQQPINCELASSKIFLIELLRSLYGFRPLHVYKYMRCENVVQLHVHFLGSNPNKSIKTSKFGQFQSGESDMNIWIRKIIIVLNVFRIEISREKNGKRIKQSKKEKRHQWLPLRSQYSPIYERKRGHFCFVHFHCDHYWSARNSQCVRTERPYLMSFVHCIYSWWACELSESKCWLSCSIAQLFWLHFQTLVSLALCFAIAAYLYGIIVALLLLTAWVPHIHYIHFMYFCWKCWFDFDSRRCRLQLYSTHTHTDLCVSSHNKLDLIFYLRLPFQSFLASDSFDGVWWRLSMTELPSAVDNPTLDRHSLILCGPLNVSLS